jgi:hypothetical protein
MPLYDENVEEDPEGYVPPAKPDYSQLVRGAPADEEFVSAEEDLDALLEAHNRGQLKINYYQAVYQNGVVTDDGTVEAQEVNEEARHWVRGQIVQLIKGGNTNGRGTSADQLTAAEVAQVRAMLASPPSQFSPSEVAIIKSLANKVQRLEPTPIKTTVVPATPVATPVAVAAPQPKAARPTAKVGHSTSKVGPSQAPQKPVQKTKAPKKPVASTEYKVVNTTKAGIEEVVVVKPAPRARLPGALPFPSPSQMEAISFMNSQKTTAAGTPANAHDMSTSELARTKRLIG